MAVELMGYAKMEEQMAIQEAASAGLRSLEHLIFQLSSHQSQGHQKGPIDCREMTDLTVSKFKKMISILNRTGHARFRRGPTVSSPPPAAAPSHSITLSPPPHMAQPIQSLPPPPPPPPPQSLTLDFTKPITGTCPVVIGGVGGEMSTSAYTKESFSLSTPMSSANSSFFSSITGDGSVSNGKQGGTSLLLAPVPAAATVSAGKPPLSSSYKKKCHGHAHSEAASGGRCHCSKRR